MQSFLIRQEFADKIRRSFENDYITLQQYMIWCILGASMQQMQTLLLVSYTVRSLKYIIIRTETPSIGPFFHVFTHHRCNLFLHTDVPLHYKAFASAKYCLGLPFTNPEDGVLQRWEASWERKRPIFV